MDFKDFNFNKRIDDALRDVGYVTPTQIQQEAIPVIMEGKDVLGCAQTGTGKTAAFALPILNIIEPKHKIQVLVLTPTRELAIQVHDNFKEYAKYLKINSIVIFGGVKQQHQVKKLNQGVDVLIATPGRLLDLINQGYISLSHVKHFILDEADNMLDMGFIHDINKIVKLLPQQRQTLLFSATMPNEIKKMASKLLKNPTEISVAPVSSTAKTIKQTLYYVDKGNKAELLIELLQDKKYHSTLVFTKTKHGADRLVKVLKEHKFKAAAIHGNKSQNNRVRTLQEFKDAKINTLVATDIAARGIDISDLSYVVNYEIPNVSETYVHRIGRTGRAGQTGEAISLCDFDEKAYIRSIEKLTDEKIEVIDDHSFPMTQKTASPKAKPQGKSKGNRNYNTKQHEHSKPSAKGKFNGKKKLSKPAVKKKY